MFKKIVMALIITMFLAGSANAWYLELGSGVLGGTYQTSTFTYYDDGSPIGDLDQIFLALAVDTPSSVLAVQVPTITGGMFGFDTVWTTANVTPGNDGNIFYNFAGYNPSVGSVPFNPADGTLLLTAVWAADPGNVSFTGYNNGIEETVSIQWNGNLYTYGSVLPGGDVLEAYDGGQKIGPTSPAVVPIPGAVYLLASGLIGLIGLRRRG